MFFRESVYFRFFVGKKIRQIFFYIKKIEEKPCPNDHNLKKAKMKKGKKKNSLLKKERKISEKK